MLPTPSLFPKSPVVDTNILFDFLVWRFSTDAGGQIPPPLLTLVRSRPLKELDWYLDAARPIQTSSQVVAEIHWLARSRARLRDRSLHSFWTLARQEFERLELAEYLVTMVEMDLEDLVKYGPADASVLRLAIRRDAAVLTSDGPLGERCVEQEIRVLNYDRVLELWKQSMI